MGAQGDQTKPCGFVVPLFLFPVQYFEGGARESDKRVKKDVQTKKNRMKEQTISKKNKNSGIALVNFSMPRFSYLA